MEVKAEISIADLFSISLSMLGLVGLLFAYLQLRLSRQAAQESARASRSSFGLEIHKWFRSDPDEMSFFYRLDYSNQEGAFVFRETEFRHSDDERYLDSLLLKLVFVGSLLRNGVLEKTDISWMTFIVRTILSNEEVHKYLQWIHTDDQVPYHSEFVDAIFLYQSLAEDETKASTVLEEYSRQAQHQSRA